MRFHHSENDDGEDFVIFAAKRDSPNFRTSVRACYVIICRVFVGSNFFSSDLTVYTTSNYFVFTYFPIRIRVEFFLDFFLNFREVFQRGEPHTVRSGRAVEKNYISTFFFTRGCL